MKWIKTHLGPNPFNICTDVTRERCSSWPRIGSSDGEHQNGCKTKYLFTNSHYAPKNKRTLILHRLNRQTWARSSRLMHGCNIKVQQCSQSYLYLLSAFKSATVTDCRDLTVVLGPVTTLLDVSNCKNLRIIAMTRRIHITNCNKVMAYLRTPSRPLLLGSRNLNIRFAPYNTFYPLLEKQMEKAGITTYLNMWDQCLCIYNKMKVEELTSQLSIMPSTFNLFTVPFEMEGETKDIPGGLPLPYQHFVNRKQEIFQSWQQRILELDLSDEQKESISKTVQQKFKHWLRISGYQQEIDSLATLSEKLSMELTQ
ncbi:TBCC domain-containing protein 1-like [Centruroides sculpturatus]|uniref:TBCC domain-containing protein 1-like n=1 Tax=Centruroides sculpturatus TaxID=218467 RepID=UPI000C6E2CE1|nr:TBCC domain-containing protein 1-like [Centruroides sculpturatus]